MRPKQTALGLAIAAVALALMIFLPAAGVELEDEARAALTTAFGAGVWELAFAARAAGAKTVRRRRARRQARRACEARAKSHDMDT